MRFGKSAEEAANEPARSSGTGSYIKRPKEGKNTVRILDEPDAWIYFWEHFNPNGYSFPCTGERDSCPGCTSDVVKMKKANYKVAMNCFDGQYTNVWSFPNQAVGEKLKARYERLDTITDRDYMITQIKNAGGVEYDVEGLDKEPLSAKEWEELRPHMQAVEPLLAEAYEQSWGDSAMTREAKTEQPEWSKPRDEGKPALAKEGNSRLAIKREEPKPEVEEKVVSESELRAMDVWDLVALAKSEGLGDIPPNTDSPDEIVDWMLSKI